MDAAAQVRRAAFLATALLCAFPAAAADDHFFKETPDSLNGFLAARDPTYVRECGSCHFAHSPGLLPARSWVRQMERMEKHFGETVRLPAEKRDHVQRYLVENAADRSAYAGSRTFMERVDPAAIPYRLLDVPLYREMHAIIREVIDSKPRVKVRTLTNCNGCHQGAGDGSFGLSELVVPGLTRTQR